MLKSILCGDIRPGEVGRSVTVAGWVHRRRDHGGLIFIDLRDSSGIIQVVFQPDVAETFTVAERFRSEWVVQVEGDVRVRPDGTANAGIPTGDVEILAKSTVVLNAAKTPPFEVSQDSQVDEQLRMRYRYLDLRRPFMQGNLRLRHRLVKFIRDYLDGRGFLEIETPILIKSTPEGARDYLVPSRNHSGAFYALPQSPQQLKQLLMVAGTDKYFQIARCFRDEDLRADRQPEFTQLDLEMAWVEADDIIELMLDLYVSLAKAIAPDMNILEPVPRIPYEESIRRFGTDKPDIRFGMEITKINEAVPETSFKVFRTIIEDGGLIAAIVAPGMGDISRRQIDELIDLARSNGASGLVTIALSDEIESLGNIIPDNVRTQARALSMQEITSIASLTGAAPGDLILIAAGPDTSVYSVLGQLRIELGSRLNLADPNTLAFCVITDFPLFEWDEVEGRWFAMHHPFTSPTDESWEIIARDPGAAVAKAYDLAANGSELAGGSIRVHRREQQEQLFGILGYEQSQIQELFGHLLEAFDYGAPPHGGFAGGIDRLVVTLARNADSIRDAIAFPKTQAGVDLLFGSPSPVSPEQLSDLKIAVVLEDH